MAATRFGITTKVRSPEESGTLIGSAKPTHAAGLSIAYYRFPYSEAVKMMLTMFLIRDPFEWRLAHITHIAPKTPETPSP
jgi:hypothetical protein